MCDPFADDDPPKRLGIRHGDQAQRHSPQSGLYCRSREIRVIKVACGQCCQTHVGLRVNDLGIEAFSRKTSDRAQNKLIKLLKPMTLEPIRISCNACAVPDRGDAIMQVRAIAATRNFVTLNMKFLKAAVT
jgi:hypothetical protein